MTKRGFLGFLSAAGFLPVLCFKAAHGGEKVSEKFKGPFGSCCKDLSDAMKQPPSSFFFVEKNQVLYLTVGYVQTEKGPGWFDQAVIFCPFCGKQLQSREEIAKKAARG
ncbi:hypothetical protein [Sulfurifustis variabilis]|uniref:hypothetical protein n=1 Tax=Sulfurifustis variabilis TaxID=1675686 RepID=UPI0011E4CB77|nr:hypothetical protein [Sulfurifustis variabilis]